MAEQPIDKNQIIKDGTIEDVIKQFKDWETQLKKNNKALLELAKNTEIKPVINTEDFAKLLAKVEKLEALYKKQSENTKQLTTIERERLKLIKATETAEAKKIIAINKENKALIELQQETNKANKAQRDAIKTSERQKNAYTKLSDETLKLKNESKRLGAEMLALEDKGQKNSIAWNKLSKAYDKVTRSAQLGDARLKRLDKTTGDTFRNVGNYTERLKLRFRDLASQVGITFGIMGAFRVVKSAVNSVREFELQNATLAGVLNKTRVETLRLTASQIKYGSSTQFTAKQVGELQTAYARIGFTQSQILGATKNTLDLATALDAGLGESAELVGSTMKSFNLTVNDTDNIVNSLTRSTQKSKLDFQALKESLSFVAPTAKTLNISLEETLGLLGVLTDNGIKASRSGRLLSSSFLKLAEEGKTLEFGLNQITKAQEEGKTALEVASVASETFGKESATLGIILADNRDKVKELTKEIENNGNAAKDLADEKLKTLDGAIKLLTSAWDGFILKLNDSTQGGNALSAVIVFLAKNLETLIKVLGVTISTLASYAIGTKINAVLTTAWTTATKASTIAQRIQTTAVLLGSKAVKAFNLAMKANPLGLIIALLALATSAYYAFSDSVDISIEAQEKFNKSREESLEVQRDVNSQEKKLLEDRFDLLGKDAEKRKALGEDSNKVDIDLLKKKKQIIKEEREALKKQIDDQNKIRSGQLIIEDEQGIQAPVSEARIQGTIEGLNERELALDKAIKESERKAELSNIKLTKSQQAEAVKREKNLQSLLRRTEDLRIQALKDDEEREIQATNTKFDRELKAIKGNTEIENNLRIQLEINLQLELSEIRDKFRLKEAEEKQKVYDDDVRRQEALNKELKTSIQKKEADDARALIAERKAKRKAEEIERKKEAEKLKETYTNVLNTVSSTFTTLNSMISDSIDTAIEGQNRLIANSQRTIDLIKQSAIAGNEQAKESILAEEKAIEESQKRIEKAQKRKQRMELISTGINTFNQKVASGQGGLQALGETGAQMAGLIGLLNSLPSFFIGADRLSSDGAPIDNKGGFLAINHPDERIVPASKNKIIGFDTSNEKLANIMSYYNKGLLVPAGKVGVIPVQNDNSEVLKSIENGFSKINNYNMSVEELFGQISVIVEQKKNGNIHRSKKTFR